MSTPQLTRMLVAVDFSEPSQAAVAYAAELARDSGARLDLLHVCEPAPILRLETVLATVGTGPPWTLADIARRDAREQLLGMAEEAKLHHVEPAALLVETGDPRRVIPSVAERDRYDLLVLGTRGRTGLDRALLGSVAEGVLRRASCPVLTVHGKRSTLQPPERHG